MIQKTSLEAYNEIKRSGVLKGNKDKILWVLAYYGSKTDLELESITGMKINAVTGARNKLLKEGHITSQGTKIAETGRRNIIWGVNRNVYQYNLF